MVQDKREFLVWRHRLNHCYFKSLFRLSKRGIITRELSKFRKLPLCVACIFGSSHRSSWRTKENDSCLLIRKPPETITEDMTSVEQTISDQPGLITQVIGALTHGKLWAATIFLDHY